MYRTHFGLAQYLCQSWVQNSLWRCAISISVLCTERTADVRSIYVSLYTELTMEVRSFYFSLFTALPVEVRCIYVSPVYRAQCRSAQYLCQSVYRTHCGCAQHQCQSVTELTVELRNIYVSLWTALTMDMRGTYVNLSTELTVEVRSIYVCPLCRTHFVGAHYLCQSCLQNSLWRFAVSMSVLRTKPIMGCAVSLCQSCIQNSLWMCAVSISVCVHNSLWGVQYQCQSVYRTQCGVAQYLCQSCVQNPVWKCAVSMSVYRTHCVGVQSLSVEHKTLLIPARSCRHILWCIHGTGRNNVNRYSPRRICRPRPTETHHDKLMHTEHTTIYVHHS
jgi:hypothetical protein